MVKRSDQPIVFIGHGSPMNAIEENAFSLNWRRLGEYLETHFEAPKGIIAISAHWYTDKTRTNTQEQPRQIYDMYGFPEALYQLLYPAPGAPDLAEALTLALAEPPAQCSVLHDNQWGIDHGTWSVLTHVFPKAQIPVVQLSIDRSLSPENHLALGRQLAHLREKGYFIFASGNVVHHLGLVRWELSGGFDWAYEFDNAICEAVLQRDYSKLVHYKSLGDCARQAVPTPDHYLPLLYAMGAVQALEASEDLRLSCAVINQACLMGSLSMTSYIFGIPQDF